MKSILTFAVFFVICFVGFGCSLSGSTEVSEAPKQSVTPKETLTKITKEVLKERLSKKGIEVVPPLDETKPFRPNPLNLILTFVSGGPSPKLNLNNEEYEYNDLVKKLKEVFKERQENGVLKEGTNEIEKEIKLIARDKEITYYNSNSISVEDFEKLIDDLRKEGIDQLKLLLDENQKIPEKSDS